MVLRGNSYTILLVRSHSISISSWFFDYTPRSHLNLARNLIINLYITNPIDILLLNNSN